MPPDADLSPNLVLSRALRAIRRQRGLSAAQVAQSMNLPRRSYEYFEAGGGRLNFARVIDFAEATHSDAYAILAAVFLGTPDFARRCADNKLATILLLALQDFHELARDDLTRLSPQALISTFEAMFSRLAADAHGDKADAAAWMSARKLRRRL